MHSTQYVLERFPSTTKPELLRGDGSTASMGTAQGIKNGRIIRFANKTTAEWYVSQDPKHRKAMPIRDIEALLHTSHSTIQRFIEDGERAWAHLYDIAYTLGKEEGDSCFYAVGVPGKNGAITLGNINVARLVYEQHHKLMSGLPPGMTVTQTCGHRTCINPDHLRTVSVGEFNRTKNSKLSPATVEEIKAKLAERRTLIEEGGGDPRASGLSYSQIAAQFRIDTSMVSRIDSGDRKAALA
jgi:hypothetical protein